MAYKRKKYRKLINSTKVEVDGIKFASTLEKDMYLALMKASLFDKYEEESFILLEGFQITNSVYERQRNAKGDFKDRGWSNVRPQKYTPDFTSHDYIIEVKGRANHTFPNTWKHFKSWLNKNKDGRTVYLPSTRKEIDETIQLITSRRKNTKD